MQEDPRAKYERQKQAGQPGVCLLRKMFEGDDRALLLSELRRASKLGEKDGLMPDKVWKEQSRAFKHTPNEVMFFLLTHIAGNPSYRADLAPHCTPSKFQGFTVLLDHAFMCLVRGLAKDGTEVETSQQKWLHGSTDFTTTMRSIFML